MLDGITLDRKLPVPLRHQLVAHLETRILDGDIPPGRRLPSVRRVADRLSLHRNTVAAAYREMALRGLVVRRHGSGVYVHEQRAHLGPLAEWADALRFRRLALIASDDPLAVTLGAELRSRYRQVSVRSFDPAALERRSVPRGWIPLLPTAPGDAPFQLPCGSPPALVLRLAAPPWFRRAVASLPRPSVVAACSASEAVHRLLSRALLLACGEGVGYAPLYPDWPVEGARLASLARMVVADAAAHDRARLLLGPHVMRLDLITSGTTKGLGAMLAGPVGTSP
jgi:DNA-binding transcriptional regulator YhcF (GntR family)